MDAPLVSIVMPAYQAAHHVGRALDALLAQDWLRIEIVAVDDGSGDATGEILDARAAISPVPMRVLRQKNAGAGAARDAGIAVAEGDFVLLADADDTCDPGLVTALMSALEETGADLAFARCRYTDADGTVLGVQAVQPARPSAIDLLRGLMVNTPLVRRSAVEAIGGHDATLPGSIDLDLFVRLAMRREGALAACDAVLSEYRRHDGQITSDWRRMEASWTRVRDKAVASGLVLTPGERSRMRGRHCAYWATLAYMAGAHGDARRLVLEALRRDPAYVAYDPMARIRLVACAASLLPERLHEGLRSAWNGRGREGT